MDEWMNKGMNEPGASDHLLTWQENVLFNKFPVEITAAPMVFISTFRTWEKGCLKSRGFRITALSNRVFTLMCWSQTPCESRGRAVMANVRATSGLLECIFWEEIHSSHWGGLNGVCSVSHQLTNLYHQFHNEWQILLRHNHIKDL